MHGATAEAVAVALLLASLAVAIVRPLGLSEAAVAVPAAAVVVLTGIVPVSAARHTLHAIGPSVAFLAAILVFGHLCADAGVFDYLGALAARVSHGHPVRLLSLVVTMAAAVTAVLTLDATVVLLTPVVLASAGAIGAVTRPHAYASTRLANSGSLLLPVSNLTNLLAFSASSLSFVRFATLMALPWVVVCAAEWLVLRLAFRRDLASPAEPVEDATTPLPVYAVSVVALTVAGFVATSAADIAPAWAAAAGCVALLAPRVRRRDIGLRPLVRAASIGFCLFVLALAVIVDGVTRHGLADALRHAVPSHTGLLALLGLAATAAVLANVVNNLPATLALVPLVAGSPAAVLAVLLGVNIGPNAAYPGSLATLLWRRLVPRSDRPPAPRFHAIGFLSVPALLAASTLALWASVQVIGVG